MPHAADPAVRQRVDSLKARIQTLVGDDEHEHYLVGKDILAIADEKLYRPLGYVSMKAFLAAELPSQSRSQLMLYAAVAREFSEETAVRHGMTRLGKLLTLREVLDLDVLPDPPDVWAIAVPRPEGGKVIKTFEECSAADLQRAIRAAKGADDAVPPEANELAHRLQSALEAALGADSPAGVRVRAQDGQLLVTLAHVPADNLDELGALLKTV